MTRMGRTPRRTAGGRRTGLRSRAVRTVGLAVLLGSTLVGGIAVILVQGALTRSLDDTLATKVADVGAQLSEGQPGVPTRCSSQPWILATRSSSRWSVPVASCWRPRPV